MGIYSESVMIDGFQDLGQGSDRPEAAVGQQTGQDSVPLGGDEFDLPAEASGERPGDIDVETDQFTVGGVKTERGVFAGQGDGESLGAGKSSRDGQNAEERGCRREDRKEYPSEPGFYPEVAFYR